MRTVSLATARHRIYEAALDPEAWSLAIKSLQDLTAAHSGAIFVADWKARAGLVHQQRGLDDELWNTWLAGAIANDEWSAALSGLPGGFVATGRSAVSKRTLCGSDFYNQYLAPRRIQDVLCSSLAKQNNVHSIVSLYRHKEFSSTEIEILTRLAPDLRLAVRLQRELGDLRAHAELAERALDAVPVGLLLLDSRGRVHHANRKGESLVRRADGIQTVAGRLCCKSHAETNRLHAAIARVAEGVSGRLEGKAVAVAASRGAHRRALALLVAPILLKSGSPSALVPTVARADAQVVVTVNDPDETIRLSEEALTQQFSLTPAEARLAAALAARKSLEEYAALSGLTMNTVRSTLKRLFAKTDCRRQSELVLVLASSALVASRE